MFFCIATEKKYEPFDVAEIIMILQSCQRVHPYTNMTIEISGYWTNKCP